MKLTLTSIKKVVLDIDNVDSINIPTKTWYITVLPNHEAIVSVVVPWVLAIKAWYNNYSYALWWWILETDGKNISIIADMVEDWEWLNIEEIRAKKENARKLMEEYREQWKMVDMDRYIELEMDFLKESAKEQLALK